MSDSVRVYRTANGPHRRDVPCTSIHPLQEGTASPPNGARLPQKMQEHPMSETRQYHKRQAKAIQRRRLKAHERLERDRHQAQRAAEALHQALEALGLPTDLVVEIEGRLHSQQKLLGKMVGI